MLMAFPFLEEIARPLVLVIPLAAIFVVGVLVTDSGPSHIRRALVLAAIQVAFTVLSLADQGERLYSVAVTCALLATAALILFAAYCVMSYVLRARVITRDQIYAGVSMYLMLGFAFGAVFYLINILNPASFSANTPSARETPDLMYFSFVTLATLGYGDITPRTNLARSLAVLESIAGMLYIAVFMARLVSMRSSTEQE
jgi:ion channel